MVIIAIPDDNVLQVQGEGVVICTYIDTLQNTGATTSAYSREAYLSKRVIQLNWRSIVLTVV